MNTDELRNDPDTYPNIKFKGVLIVMVPNLRDKFGRNLSHKEDQNNPCVGCKFNSKRYTRDGACTVQDELDDLGLSCYRESTIFVNRLDFKYYLADAVAARMSDSREYVPSKPQRARRER